MKKAQSSTKLTDKQKLKAARKVILDQKKTIKSLENSLMRLGETIKDQQVRIHQAHSEGWKACEEEHDIRLDC